MFVELGAGSGAAAAATAAMSKHLPVGWEKRLDTTTGMYIYIDHNNQKVYNQPPTPATPPGSPSSEFIT